MGELIFVVIVAGIGGYLGLLYARSVKSRRGKGRNNLSPPDPPDSEVRNDHVE